MAGKHKSNAPGTPLTRYKEWRRKRPQAVGMLMEGDSWFAFPMLLRTNLTNELKSVYQDKIVQLALARVGDDVREILSGKQYANLYKLMAKKGLSFDCILFSGGGNDVVDVNLPLLLRTYQQGASWEDCIHMERFDRRLKEIECAYLDLADLRDDLQQDAWIFSHGYDHARASGEGVKILGIKAAGGWIKDRMNAKNIPKRFHQPILDHMLGSLDDMLIRLEQTQRRWIHVRTQGTLSKNDWGDELHPTTKGFGKISAKFQAALETVFPQLTD